MLCFAGALQEKHRSVLAKKNVVAGGDSCTGTLELSAHFENSDTVTTGTPAGCNANADQTWALASGYIIYTTTNNPAPSATGSYNIHVNNAAGSNVAYADISVDLGSAGTIVFDIYVTTAADSAEIFKLYADANNYMLIRFLATTTNLRFDTHLNSTDGLIDSTGEYLTTGEWHTVTVKWSHTAVDSKYLSIQIDANAAVLYSFTIGEFSGTTSLRIGQPNYVSVNYKIDNLKVYNSWQ